MNGFTITCMSIQKTQPLRAKGRRYPIEISCVAWIDLLGYGAMLKEIDFDPSHSRAEAAVNRLKRFQREVTSFASRNFPAMAINDGIAFFHDLSPRSNSVTYIFLERAISVFERINEVENSDSYPGARMVIAAGPRMRIRDGVKDSPGLMRNILRRVKDGVITAEQAIHEAFRSGPVAGFVPQLQANFAFTKAYCADEAGSKAGLGGNHCFIDLCLFNEQLPPWMRFRRTQMWSMDGMSAIFGELEHLDRQVEGGRGFVGILNALEVAKRLNLEDAFEAGQ